MADPELFRLRTRYRETGRLRYLSHLELLRAMERTIRRAGLPYAVTQGFSPRIKAAYCPALPVGVGSYDEWFDLWLREPVPVEECLASLRRAAPFDLEPQECAYVDRRSPSLSAALTLATWEVEVSERPGEASRLGIAGPRVPSPSELAEAFERVFGTGEITYLRDGKPKTVGLEGKIARAPEVSALKGVPGVRAVLTTRSSNEGALRPDVLMGAVLGQLAETYAVCGELGAQEAGGALSWTGCMRTSIMRTAQHLEGKDGTWVRPI